VLLRQGLGVGEPPGSVEQQLLAVQQARLQVEAHALQRQVGRRRLKLRRGGGAVRADMGHAAVGELVHQVGAADELGRLILRAPIRGEQPIVSGQQVLGYQPVEQVADPGAPPGRYQRRSAPCGAKQPSVSAGWPLQPRK